MEMEIDKELAAIEHEEGVKILFAIESGSRAWGFPSTDSDYDVRFVYVRPQDWYLSVFEGRDVIERPISGLLDINGWDLRKALALLRKSNPALMEWLNSPIVYRNTPCADALRALTNEAFLPLASCHHYRSMFRQHQSRSAGRNKVRIKHYLYSIRPILAARWVITHQSQPPMRFVDLLEAFLPSDRFALRLMNCCVSKR